MGKFSKIHCSRNPFKKVETQAFMGRNQLYPRLSAQVGNSNLAKNILINRGDMNLDGSFTNKGEIRNSMTASERAIDRASKSSGNSSSDYTYNPTTNKATLKT